MLKCKKILSLFLAFALCLGLFAGLVTFSAATTETKYGAATEMVTGEYTLVVPEVTPTGMSKGPYYVKHDTAVNPGLLFAPFDKDNHESADVWKVTKVSDTQCTLQNEELGEAGYVNLSPDYVGYGSKVNLNYEFVGGKCRFFVTSGGKNWYLRFTNSSMNESRFQCGTGTASHEFYLYGMITEVKEDPAPELEIPPVTGDPIFTIACISDLHADYGLQNKSPYVRQSVVDTIYAIADEENADILLVGGDNTSDNGNTSDKGGWTYSIFSQVIEKYRELGETATKSGRSLWACGNHDYQAGEEEGYDAYADYEAIMVDSCGEPLSVYRQKDDKSLKSDQRYPEFVLGMHFNIDGFDFIVMNAPYSKAQTYSTGTLQWLGGRLKSIGKDKTVFLLTHYPLTDSRNISTPTYGTSGSAYTSLTSILRNYPNTIMLYGHNHGGSDHVYINEDTFERITPYTKAGKVVNDRNVVPTSFITSFMGSMSYYNNSIDSGWLTERDPKVVQALMLYIYEDRIVFQMKNYGEKLADVTPRSWTVMREMVPTVKEPSTDDVSDNTTSDEIQDTPMDITEEFLVTTGINDKVKYDSTKSIGKYNFTGTDEWKSFKNSLIADSLPEGLGISVRKLVSGDEYTALKNALAPVVTEFVPYIFSAKKDGKEVEIDGFVKVTVSALKDEFGPYSNELTPAVYYLDADGVLHMTDVEINEKDETMSFLLPKLTPFAISARANVKDIPEGEDLPLITEVDTDTSTDLFTEGEGGSILWIVLIVVGVVVIAVAVLLVVLTRKKKPVAAEPNETK